MHAGVGKPFFEFGTEPPACQLQCWSLEPYLKQWLLQEEATRNMPSDHATGAFLGSLVRCAASPLLHPSDLHANMLCQWVPACHMTHQR